MMIYEWVNKHKKSALLIAVALFVVIGVVITLLANFVQHRDDHEETDLVASVQVTNIDVLYDHFSDYEIGTILNAINKALADNQSMKNGSPASEDKTPPATATDEQLYPNISKGRYDITVKDGAVADFEDSWGTWKKFTITTQDKRTFDITVSVGAYSQANDPSYTQISIIKQ